jgi:hypothetical protein
MLSGDGDLTEWTLAKANQKSLESGAKTALPTIFGNQEVVVLLTLKTLEQAHHNCASTRLSAPRATVPSAARGSTLRNVHCAAYPLAASRGCFAAPIAAGSGRRSPIR